MLTSEVPWGHWPGHSLKPHSPTLSACIQHGTGMHTYTLTHTDAHSHMYTHNHGLHFSAQTLLHIHPYWCTHTHNCTLTFTLTQAHTQTHMHTQSYRHIHAYQCTLTLTQAHTCTHSHIHTHLLVHTHSHTHTHLLVHAHIHGAPWGGHCYHLLCTVRRGVQQDGTSVNCAETDRGTQAGWGGQAGLGGQGNRRSRQRPPGRTGRAPEERPQTSLSMLGLAFPTDPTEHGSSSVRSPAQRDHSGGNNPPSWA